MQCRYAPCFMLPCCLCILYVCGLSSYVSRPPRSSGMWIRWVRDLILLRPMDGGAQPCVCHVSLALASYQPGSLYYTIHLVAASNF